MKKLLHLTFILFLVSIVVSCGIEEHIPQYDKETSFALGTYVTITIPHKKNNNELISCIFNEIERISKKYSLERKDSYINKINRLAGKSFTGIDNETFMLIKNTLAVSRATDGCFDITTGCLKELWGFNSHPHLPKKDSIKEALTKVGYNKIELGKNSVKFDHPGLEMDFGGIAKGYAVDRGIEILKKRGVSSAIIDAGGDIFALGVKLDSEQWRIGIKNPRGRGLIKVVTLKNKAIATSGDYENYFFKDGVRYCHIFDPFTGYPANNFKSVTVIAQSTMLADALATAVFVMGDEEVGKVEEKFGVKVITY